MRNSQFCNVQLLLTELSSSSRMISPVVSSPLVSVSIASNIWNKTKMADMGWRLLTIMHQFSVLCGWVFELARLCLVLLNTSPNRPIPIYWNSYLAARLWGIKQKKSSWSSSMSNTFLLSYFPKPQSQVWILIYRKWSIERKSVTSQKFKFMKLWDWLAYSSGRNVPTGKEQRETAVFP